MKVGKLALSLLFGSFAALPAAEAAERPHIILIMADDMGFSDLGCYGSGISTPNLDRLAAGGLRFSQFYNNAKCAPSRASLLTGLYPQQEPNSKGHLTGPNLSESLRAAGYRTLMTGRNGGLAGSPVRCGFDRFYGLLDSGCCNYFNPGLKRPGEEDPGRKYPGEQRAWAIDTRKMQPFTPEDRDFYSTDAITDAAVEYINQYGRDDRPFFLYMPQFAPHFPIHARPEEIAKYRGKYKTGWDVLRQRRYDRLVELGLIRKQWKLSRRDETVPAWDSLGDGDKERWELYMAVYAAMIDRMDQGIGRIMEKLRELGIEENTLVIFLSDNGACAEDDAAFKATARGVPPGPMESYRTQGVGWANASNTPFRKFKWWLHEGGTATPFIVRWPRVIKQGGLITHEIGHIMDIVPTCLEAAGATRPELSMPLEGRSLVPLFEGRKLAEREALYWQFGLCRAVRKGKWKLVASHPNPRLGIDYFKEGRASKGRKQAPWELYDLEADRTEQNNLARAHPERVRELAELYGKWRQRVAVRLPSR